MLKLQGLEPRFVKIQPFAFGLSRVLASISLNCSAKVHIFSHICKEKAKILAEKCKKYAVFDKKWRKHLQT